MGLGVCPPGHYGPAIMLPGGSAPAPAQWDDQAAKAWWDPYTDSASLKGDAEPSPIRWDLLVLTFGLSFAGFLGYAFYRSRK